MTDAMLSDLASADAYFDRFVQAFTTFDATKVADLFMTPGVALRRDGSLVGLTTRDERGLGPGHGSDWSKGKSN